MEVLWVSSSPMNTLEPQVIAISAVLEASPTLGWYFKPLDWISRGNRTRSYLASNSGKNMARLSSEPTGHLVPLYMEIWIPFLINDANSSPFLP